MGIVVNISVGKRFLKMVFNHFKTKCSKRDKTKVVLEKRV